MELLERASQLRDLGSALAQAKAGQGCVALVYGEAGIGKTSLVEHFVKKQKTSWRILQGVCDSLSTPGPLGPLHDIAAQTQGNLLNLLDSETNRAAIFSASLNELKEQATIMIIEDVHWADEATLDLLKYLGRRIRQTSSLMILTFRDDEIGNDHPLRVLLGDLATSHALHRIPVSSLSPSAVHELAKNKNVDSLVLHHLTNGNPFFVTEVLAVESGIPETVRDAVLARAARLSAIARSVLEVAAVIGSRIEARLLSDIVGAESVYVEECIVKGMLQLQDDYYAFRHELARQTIIESISLQRRIALHRMILNALKKSPETRNDLARLANHAEGTGDAYAVLEYAPAAGRQASALGAHRQAATHFKTALQYANRMTPEERAELLDSYSDECIVIHQSIEAKNIQEEALVLWRELGRREKEGRALRRLSEIVMRLYQKEKTDRYATEAIEILEALPPSRELAMAYSHISRIHMVAYQDDEAIHWGRRAMELAEKLGDIEALIHALSNIGAAQMSHNQRTEGLINQERSLRLSIHHDYHYQAGRTFYNLAYGLIVLHEYEAGLTYVNEGSDYCAKHDLDTWRFRLLSLRDQSHFEQGHWAELKTSSSEIDLPFLRSQVRRGNPISTETLDSMRKIVSSTVFLERIYPITVLLAEMAWLQGDLAKCRSEIEPIFKTVCKLNIPREIGEFAYWMWRAGAITEPPTNAVDPYTTQINGDWQTAASMWEKFGCPYEQAMALMDGDEVAQFKALEIFERLGARPIIHKLKQKMHAEGIRIPHRSKAAAHESPVGLTAREIEILRLVSEGLSNQEIADRLVISRRTVHAHLRSIYEKLGVTTRTAAVHEASRFNLL